MMVSSKTCNLSTLGKVALPDNGVLNLGDLARPSGNCSNALFETLEDWEHQLSKLQSADFDEGPQP